jgi:hypothetical protein
MNPNNGGNAFMKKVIFCSIVLLLLIGTVGCSRKDKYIDTDDVTVSTLLARSNGKIQVATIEDFDKPYYDLSELQDFISEQVTTFNKSTGDDKITVNSVEKRDNKAVMLLTYSGMEQYATFNDVTAAYFNGGVENISLDLPTTLVNAKNESLASTEEVLQNDKYKILVLTEPYNVITDGKVKFYSENVTLTEDNKLQSTDGDMSVIVFKP